MNHSAKFRIQASIAALALCGLFSSANAAGIVRVPIPMPNIPIAAAVVVPPGYTTYYLSGAIASVADPKAPIGSEKHLGDTATQTASVLSRLKEELAKLGLTFGDVVQAHAYMVGDPAKGGKMDFMGMNKEWSKEFGTKEQPNTPARAAFEVKALAMPGALVEIEMVAVKKVK